MNRITLSKYTKLLLMSFLTSFKNEINSVELSCNITASQTYLNETQIDVILTTAVNKCAKDYRDIDIIKKCEYFIDSNKSQTTQNNSFFYRPVTNRFENITYWNEFCAICNYETNLKYWSTWTHLNNSNPACVFEEFEVLKGSASDDLHHITHHFYRNGLKLISKSSNSTELQCSMDENWPLNLLQVLVPCIQNQFVRSHNERLFSCRYLRNNGRLCTGMGVIIEGVDFAMDKNNSVYLYDQSGIQEFIQSGYTMKSELDDVIYLCEGSIPLRNASGWIITALNIFSIIFLGVYLFLNLSKSYLQSFPNKIIYSYAAGLLVMHLISEFIDLVLPLLEEAYFFSWLFQLFWTMIISLEFCRLVYSIFRKRKVSASSQPKRYFIYCIVGFVIPAALPIIYFSTLRTNRDQCPVITDHFGAPWRPVFNSLALRYYWGLWDIFYVSFSAIIPILFLLQAGVLIYVTKCGPAPIRSTANRNYSVVLMKMAYIMGAPWVLNIFCSKFYRYFTEDSVIITTARLVSAFCVHGQGVLVFLLFSFKKSWVNDFLPKFGCKKKSSPQSINTGTGTSVQPTSTTVQLGNSVIRQEQMREFQVNNSSQT